MHTVKHFALLIVTTTIAVMVGFYLLNQFSVTKPFVSKAVNG